MPSVVRFTIVGSTDDAIFIVDPDDGRVSVTNAADAVCRTLCRDFGPRRIFYRDTMRNWAEMIHEKGVFLGFAPISANLSS